MDFNFPDLRPADILLTVSGLEKYLDVIEAQLEEVHRIERQTLELEQPTGSSEEEHENYLRELQDLDDRYDHDLRPAMRYSFVVLIHIVFETKIRDFCTRIQRDLNLPQIAVTDLRGSAIDQSKLFLTRLAGIRAQDFPEWQQLRTLQKVRDCIVHAYGHIADSRDEVFLRELAAKSDGVSIDDDGRIAVSKGFCEKHLAAVQNFLIAFSCASDGTREAATRNQPMQLTASRRYIYIFVSLGLKTRAIAV